MFQPVLPLSGLPGWVLLNRTLDSQTEAFNASPQIVRDTDYFVENIGNVRTASDLVSDRRLLTVALGAFGLDDDINNRALIQKVLEDGTADPASLANRLADERYAQFSEAFGFGNSLFGANTGDFGFGERIADQFRTRSFESAVGEQDPALRLALNATRELANMAQEESASDTLWFRVMGTPPLREVMERALNLPTSFGQLDIERQLDEFKSRAEQVFNVESFSDFADAEIREDLVQGYLLRDQINGVSGLSSGSIALSLLQA
ncbi:MAG: DUF1217 domain-containing protein [Pseudomonadota bacterium]